MSYLWAVESSGRAYVLSTQKEVWTAIEYSGTDIKRVTALEECVWAIGGDHQIYVYVPAKEIPIRFKEISYENQRWNPVGGYSSKLLPSDRPPWSDQSGLIARPIDGIELPSVNWVWEEEWWIENMLDGQPLGTEGWTYALDFPTHYGPEKKWNSMVRRRKWVRHRHYTAMDMWAPIASLFSDPVKEPFIDVSVGGMEMQGQEQGTIFVWAVTVLGRVVFRHGVTDTNPEGQGWIHVPTPEGLDVYQISVGPTGLVWALCWDGSVIVRIGVTREHNFGTSWTCVAAADSDHPLFQLSVGKDVVWAVSRDGQIWFRKGIKGDNSGTMSQYSTGSGWVQMVGEMYMVTVGPNDQVWALGRDNVVYFRTGVNPSEISGKTWKAIEASFGDISRSSSRSSLVSNAWNASIMESSQMFHSISSSPKDRIRNGTSFESQRDFTPLSNSPQESSSFVQQSIFRLPAKRSKGSRGSSTSSEASETVAGLDPDYTVDDSVFHSEEDLNEDILNIASHGELDLLASTEHNWSWISAGGCIIDESQLPVWLTEGSARKSLVQEPWRKAILQSLENRQTKEVKNFKYPEAVPRGKWVKMGRCLFWSGHTWETCHIELDQQLQRLTLRFGSKKLEIQLKDINSARSSSEASTKVVILHSNRKKDDLQLGFTSDADMEDWLATINISCNEKSGKVASNSMLWGLTKYGDVYTGNLKEENSIFWNLLGGGHLLVVESCPSGIAWGIGYNRVAWVYTGGHGGGLYKGLVGHNFNVHPMTDSMCIYVYENQRWNPLTGFSAVGLPTDRYMWSDKTGRQECPKDKMRLPSCHWNWMCDWAIDYQVPGGVDSDGWQYASDFPRSYHAYKSFTDYVRRRRWYRKCKLVTSGPWQPVGRTRLLDISMQIDHLNAADSPVALWAVATNGDVMCRIGVTSQCPQGTHWEPVSAEQPFVSVSVGGKYKVWAVAKDGTAFFRNGVTAACPTGNVWFHIEPPQVGCCLKQISVGQTSVFAVDDGSRLWYRQEIVPTFPEGTSWKFVSDKVRYISAGLDDQVFAIVECIESGRNLTSHVICKRKHVTDSNKIGTGWEVWSGGGWQYVSVRACSGQT